MFSAHPAAVWRRAAAACALSFAIGGSLAVPGAHATETAGAAQPAASVSGAATSTRPAIIRDDRGREHRFNAPPQRIVSMMPSLTELAWVLDAGPRLVGVDRYSNWPAAVSKLPHLGGLEDAHIEAIAALKPDVILASSSSRAMDRLEALGFTVVRFKSDSHADLQRTLQMLAHLLGQPAQGVRAWDRIQAEIDHAAARIPQRLRGQRVYFEIGGGPYAAGTTSFIGETLLRLGMRNIVPADLGPFPKLNPEFVVRADPDIIMGHRREQVALGQRPGWSSMAAIQHQQLCGFDEASYEMLVRPGPRLGEAASRVADCLVKLDEAIKSASAGVTAAKTRRPPP